MFILIVDEQILLSVLVLYSSTDFSNVNNYCLYILPILRMWATSW